jgi:hypothetical protein
MAGEQKLRSEIRSLLYVFVVGLILSGITAFPIHTELTYAHNLGTYFGVNNPLSAWIGFAYKGVDEANRNYPFMAYGTDWLAFAHLILAVLFLGVVKDPVRNIWVFQFGLISCAGIFPLAFIAGALRGIPFFWQLIDCSFGLFGGIILLACHRKVKQLMTLLSHVKKNDLFLDVKSTNYNIPGT